MPIRLVEWNVAMSLQKKTHLLADMKPTVAVLPESAHPDRTRVALEAIGASSVQWIGTNPNKGLSAVAFDGWTLRLDPSYDPGYQWVMPLHLSGSRMIRVLAVWDMNHRGSGHESARRLGACRASMQHYADFLSGESDLTIITGDFNNSVHWDKPAKRAKFGEFMDQIEARGYVSAYHAHHGSARGSEPHPTLWWMKNIDTNFHIDYTFVSRPEAVEAVVMGSHAEWIAFSDHSPMTVDLSVATMIKRDLPLAVQPGSHLSPPRDGDAALPTIPTAQANESPIGGANVVRFNLEPGSLSDIVCGVNGENFTQTLRPSHVTASWKHGVLAEVRIWGPRVLSDGSLGKRLLDHRWHDVRGSGPVAYSDLPPVVANQLHAYAAEHGL